MNHETYKTMFRGMGCVACIHVTHEKQPVRFVSHAGNEWAMTCGATRHFGEKANVDEFVAIHIDHLVQNDLSLLEVMNIPINICASREEVGTSWVLDFDEEHYIPSQDDIVAANSKESTNTAKRIQNNGHFYSIVEYDSLEHECPAYIRLYNDLPVGLVWLDYSCAVSMRDAYFPGSNIKRTHYSSIKGTIFGDIQFLAVDFSNETEIFIVHHLEKLIAKLRKIG